MKIHSINIVGLNGQTDTIDLKFNDDINIITGRNGSGKTTVLKLLWYCISANIERAVREIRFTSVKIETSKYHLFVEKKFTKNVDSVRIVVHSPKGDVLFDEREPIQKERQIERANMLTVDLFDTSIFFPTFRRIEGGFSMDNEKSSGSRRLVRGTGEIHFRESHGYGNEIQEAIEAHANRLSVVNHKFISSISTIDIQSLVTKKHNDATTKVDGYSKSLSDKIFTEIRSYRDSEVGEELALKDAISTLDRINQDVVEFESVREKAFNSLNVLSEMITSIFRHKGIRLNPRVTLGDIDQSINSDSLSAGEKQMLSFLCYNALHSNCPFFIDEPELSLHVDWQRILIDVMLKQETNNQFFIATHSPFIYSQYEDKEILIGDNRGFENQEVDFND